MGRRKSKGGIVFAIRIELILLLALGCVAIGRKLTDRQKEPVVQDEESGWTAESGDTIESEETIEVSAEGNYIKWVEFNVTCEAMAAAYELDVDSYQEDIRLNWIELLAYVGARTGG